MPQQPPGFRFPPLPHFLLSLFPRNLTPQEREGMISVAQEVIQRLQPIKQETQAIYDRVKYGLSAGGWPRVREIAADLTNGAVALEAELAEIIRGLRGER